MTWGSVVLVLAVCLMCGVEGLYHGRKIGGTTKTERKKFSTQGTVRVNSGGVRIVAPDGTPLAPGSTKGVLEISQEGVWGRVCDDNFGANDARVACRTLGFQDGSVVRRLNLNPNDATKPISTLQIRATDFDCDGDESHLLDCVFRPRTVDGGSIDCDNREDAGIECSAPGCTLPQSDSFLFVGQKWFDDVECVEYICSGNNVLTREERCPSCPVGTRPDPTDVSTDKCHCPACVSIDGDSCVDEFSLKREHGEEWSDIVTCRVCNCNDGRVRCPASTIGSCPRVPACTAKGFVLVQNECGCLECRWDDSSVCWIDGVAQNNGAIISRDKCGHCTCDNGAVYCTDIVHCDEPNCPPWTTYNPHNGCCGSCDLGPGMMEMFPPMMCKDPWQAAQCVMEMGCGWMMADGDKDHHAEEVCECLWVMHYCGEEAGYCAPEMWMAKQCVMVAREAPHLARVCNMNCPGQDTSGSATIRMMNWIGDGAAGRAMAAMASQHGPGYSDGLNIIVANVVEDEEKRDRNMGMGMGGMGMNDRDGRDRRDMPMGDYNDGRGQQSGGSAGGGRAGPVPTPMPPHSHDRRGYPQSESATLMVNNVLGPDGTIINNAGVSVSDGKETLNAGAQNIIDPHDRVGEMPMGMGMASGPNDVNVGVNNRIGGSTGAGMNDMPMMGGGGGHGGYDNRDGQGMPYPEPGYPMEGYPMDYPYPMPQEEQNVSINVNNMVNQGESDGKGMQMPQMEMPPMRNDDKEDRERGNRGGGSGDGMGMTGDINIGINNDLTGGSMMGGRDGGDGNRGDNERCSADRSPSMTGDESSSRRRRDDDEEGKDINIALNNDVGGDKEGKRDD
eukprot:TRINITY_DN66887_c3_g1_i1.p1 TRINITY_DN66887_c3_g1~~TRINITY_DN66887_c3_g1_i1.p1  ORF type:complete len:841 (+),score=131.32 TRINITY_DN66887_c3_g1_i1:26-2548(+)